jgi:hypothetical protein
VVRSMIRVLQSFASTARVQAAKEFVGRYPPGTEILLIGASRESVDHLVRQARLFYCTARGEFTECTVTMNEHARANGLGVLRQIDDAVEKAFLPAAPRRDACSLCDFLEVCGPYEEIRAERKEQWPLANLVKLRSLP